MSEIIDLESFVPALSPRFGAPAHLRPVSNLLERVARGDEVRAVVSAPPRHGKTELFLHGIPWLLLQRPEMQIAYAAYASRLAEKKSRPKVIADYRRSAASSGSSPQAAP